jgi:proteasome accessory factor PafA2
MSVPKLLGIEQEYAIKIDGAENLSAFDASCMLVNAYARRLGLRDPQVNILWDYAHETPFQDIRGGHFGKNTGQQIIGEKENMLINAGLPNGARLYTDHAHPEYSTPECLSAKDAVACDKAGEIILSEGLKLIGDTLPSTSITLYKNNTDLHGHIYGCHENYLMAADAHEAALITNPQKALKALVPFLVTRQIFTGSGKIGGRKGSQTESPYQISQRADYMENLFGLETMYARPLINTRQEHHCDQNKFRRLHLILGDANMCEFASFLKIGSTQIILQMIEDDFVKADLTLKDPIKAIKQISNQFDCAVELEDGRKLTAAQIQMELFEYAQKFKQNNRSGGVPDADFILECWSQALDGLAQLKLTDDLIIADDPLQLSQRLDWVLKLWIINRYRQGKGCNWEHPLLNVLDLQYHNIDKKEGIFYRTQAQNFTKRILTDDEIDRFVHFAPDNTRAWFRGKCIEKFAKEIYLVNWEVVGFDQGDIYRMVPLPDPLKGIRKNYQQIFDKSENAHELITLLESELVKKGNESHL